jgi:hypothetical protein
MREKASLSAQLASQKYTSLPHLSARVAEFLLLALT